MKIVTLIILCFMACSLQAQDTLFKPALYPFQLGSIKPKGWIKQQMQQDVKGFVGKLPELVSTLFKEDIYGAEQLQKHSKVKDLGNIKDGNAEGDDQYKWWNSETQSNWWDGYIRQVYAINDSLGKQRVRQYVASMLQKQEADGYLGIYQADLRYQFNGENGELWAKTTLYRALLAYYSFEKDNRVLAAVLKAVEDVMKHYQINASSPFSSGNQFNGGVSHGLTFTDVLYQLYLVTQNEQYLKYACFLYNDFSSTYQSEKDVQLASIFNSNYHLQSHGVHSFEHIRPLALAALYSKNDSLYKALPIYLKRIQQVTTITGGAIGDEWIAGRDAHETNTGYEYCSLQELMDSYALLYQLTGNTIYADKMELIFFNAAQGARHPKKSAIAYLKTDNSFKMTGTKNGENEHHNQQQTRYKYSAAHQDVAVCCAPNAGRIAPYFLQNAWMIDGKGTLVNNFLIPSMVNTTINNTDVVIETKTSYPYNFQFQIIIKAKESFNGIIKIRKPQWVTQIVTKEPYSLEGNFIVFAKTYAAIDSFSFAWKTTVLEKSVRNETYFTYGPLVYALPLPHKEFKGRRYAENIYDLYYDTAVKTNFHLVKNQQVIFDGKHLQVTVTNGAKVKPEKKQLVPLSQTILRQVTFKKL